MMVSPQQKAQEMLSESDHGIALARARHSIVRLNAPGAKLDLAALEFWRQVIDCLKMHNTHGEWTP